MKHSAITKSGKIDILVPLYLNHPSLYPIITEFFNSIPKKFNIIVCDDCSPLPLLPEWPVKYRNDTNKGFTANVNRLLSLSTADIMIVANDDLKFDNNLDWAYKTNGIYFPRDSASANLDIFGAIWAIDRKSFEKLGYLDEKLPHYGSDREYYQRAIKLGVPVVKISNVCVEHREGMTYKHTSHRA